MALTALFGLFILIFIGPYLLLFSQFQLNLNINIENFLWALKNTLLQAIGSATVSIILGLLGSLGLIWIQRVSGRRSYFWLEKFLLLPSMLPSLFVIVSCLGVIDPFPFGTIGIILIHSIINVGLVSVLFSNICAQKLGTLGDLALVEGASRWHFFRVGVWGYLKAEMGYLFLFVFALAMVSFNVPLMVGGGSGTTLEVLIYENLVIDQNWSEAITLSLIQMSIVGVVGLLQRPSYLGMDVRGQGQALQLIEWKWGAIIPIGAVLLVMFPPLFAFPRGIMQLKALDVHWSQLLGPAINSLIIGLSTGASLFVFGYAACIAYQKSWWRRLVIFYIPPGAVLVGFAFFILGRWVSLALNLQIICGLTLLYFSGLYRLALISPLAALRAQIEVAQVIGASPYKIARAVIAPQIIRPLVLMAGIGSMWATGDFALSSVLSSDDTHIALMVKSLAGSYRLDAAQTLMFFLYGTALMSFLFWWRLGDVINRKFER
jgi:thiamine transport system permease protein